MLLMLLLLLSLGVLALLFSWWIRDRTYWRRRGVQPLKTSFLLGSLAEAVRKKKAVAYIVKELYEEAHSKNLKYGGVFVSTLPGIFLADPAMVKAMGITYFDYFTDRRPLMEKGVDALLSRSLLSLRGDEWRDMRHSLTPAFTGAKLRGMVSLMSATCRNLVTVLSSQQSEVRDMRDIYRRLAADIIATTAFGAPSDALLDPESKFYAYGRGLMDFKGTRKLVVAGYLISPRLMNFLRIPFLPKQLSTFFDSIIRGNINVREEGNLSRPDMIQLLIEQRRKGATISDADIASQAFTFFLGGFETVATAMSFAAFELAVNPEVQQRLRAEVDAALERGGGHLDYDAVHGLSYMDMVVSEVLRLHPIVPVTDRACTSPLNLPEFNLNLKVDDRVLFPFYAFHHDPRYFPHPERFDPERFSEANRHDIQPFTFLPFGIGPRNCIGQRFALLEVKLALAYTLAAVELRPGPDTQVPLTLDPTKMDNSPIGGFLLRTIARPESDTNYKLT